MGKDTHFIGQPVYVQLLNLVDRERESRSQVCVEGTTDTSKSWMGTPISWHFCLPC